MSFPYFKVSYVERQAVTKLDMNQNIPFSDVYYEIKYLHEE